MEPNFNFIPSIGARPNTQIVLERCGSIGPGVKTYQASGHHTYSPGTACITPRDFMAQLRLLP